MLTFPSCGKGIGRFEKKDYLINDGYNADVIMIGPFKWSEDKDHFIIPSVFGHVQELLGHSHITTTQRYTHIVNDALTTVKSPFDHVVQTFRLKNKARPG